MENMISSDINFVRGVVGDLGSQEGKNRVSRISNTEKK